MKKENRDGYKARLLAILSRHIGRSKAIGMLELYHQVFGTISYQDKINATRELRRLVEDLRREGVPICSSMDREGGYYLASVGSDLEVYCKKLRRRALKALAMESKLRQVTLPELLGQIQLNLKMEE